MCAFDSWTRRGFAEQIRRWKLSRYAAEQTTIWRICKQIRALSRQRSLQIRTVGYSTISEALTQTGPGHHEGNSGVSVKPPLPINPAAQPRACQEFLVTFVSKTKVTRPSVCEASGAKQLLTLGTLAISQNKLPSKPAKPHLI